MLRRAGFEVLEASSGRQALTIVEERHPAVVVLDVHLPDLDGFEVCRRLKANASTAGVLVLHVSATFVEAGARVQALDNGADGYLPEPLDPREFLAQVRALLRLNELQQRLAAERAQLEAVYQAMTDGVSVFDMTGRLVMANDVVARFCGFETAAQMKREMPAAGLPFNIEELDGTPVPFEEWPVSRITGNLMANRVPRHALLVQWPRRAASGVPSGRTITILGSATPLLSADGGTRGAVAAFVDVTARKRAEEALTCANAALAHADRRKDEFLAILSHELRSPLAPIRYAVPALKGQALDADGIRAVSVVQRQVEHLTRLVDDLLDVSRIINGKIDLRREHVTVASIVKTAAEAAAPRIVAGRHKLSLLNADMVEMLAMAVEAAGHGVRKAFDGRSAISAVWSYRPHVVLLDLGLPGMSGLEVATELRRRAELAGIRLVALTGWGQPEHLRQTREAGFDHHLTKPTDPERLERLLAQIAADE